MSPAPPTGEHELLPRGRSAAQLAYDYVKARLLDGRFAGGTLLSENEIAQRLSVSRTPVRQAFVQLEAEGLLELYPRRGALVVPISPSEAEDVFEARMLIEQHAARRAAAGGPGALMSLASALRDHIADQEDALAEGGAGFAWSDRAFHRAIVEAGGNRLLTRQYDALRDRHQRIAAVTIARDPSRIERFVAEHRGIAAAFDAADADRAAELLAAHLEGAHELSRRPR
ncbi:MAG: GntR family transcriptional regulator [Thermoleophilia bacterium]|nr:GntR family transcriptional regulator [Thermoleophilia bacterium]